MGNQWCSVSAGDQRRTGARRCLSKRRVSVPHCIGRVIFNSRGGGVESDRPEAVVVGLVGGTTRRADVIKPWAERP